MAPLSIAAVNNIASTLANMGRTAEAVAMARKSLDLERRSSGPDSPDTIWSENNLASNLEKDGKLAEATDLYRDVLRRARTVFTHGEWDLGQFEYRLAKLLLDTGHQAEARALLTESIALFTRSLGTADPHTKRALAALAALPPP
jgi:tetratricopeptide (TPR) repeat protein